VRRGAFTLIEVMAVVTLLGLMAGAVAWSLAAEARDASRAHVLGQIHHVDRLARQAGRQLGRPFALRFDLDHQRLARVSADGGVSRTHTLKLPPEHRLECVLLPGDVGPAGDARSLVAATRVDSGVVEVGCSTAGRSVSYALRLASRNTPDEWVVCSGLTGQFLLIHDEGEIEKLFAILDAGRPDAP
jgi:prepilin-type N-terminal cleavage/methylation domain-containing protein